MCCSGNRLSSTRTILNSLTFKVCWLRRYLLSLPVVLSLGLDYTIAAPSSQTPLKPTQLRCEYLVDPLGIGELHPRLTWLLESDPATRGRRQTAYQILVTSHAKPPTKPGDA